MRSRVPQIRGRWPLPLLLLLLAGLWAPVGATIRYASPTGSGTACTNIATPCTLATGVSQTAGGDTLYLRAGTYAASLSLTSTTHNGSVGAPTTFARYQNEVVILQPGGNEPLLVTDSAALQYLVFNGLVFDGTGATNGTGLNLNFGAHHLTFQNGEIRNWPYNGVYIYDISHDITLQNMTIHHQISQLGTAPERWYGIYISGYNNLVQNCDIYDNPGGGIQLYPDQAQNNVIRENRIHGNNNANVTDSNIGGLGLAGSNNAFYNNLIYNNGGPNANEADGIRVFGFSGACANCVFYNNTVYGNQNWGLRLESGASANVTKNTIFYSNSGSISDAGTSSVFATNLCESAGTGCALTGDPLFVDAGTGDFRLLPASPAKDQGTNLSGSFTTDFMGTPRPQGAAWDIGAYELVPIPPPYGDVRVRVGQFSFTTSTGNHDFTIAGLGTPKAALLFLNNATTNGTPVAGATWGVGMTDCTTQQGVAFHDANALASSDANRRAKTGSGVLMLLHSSNAIDLEGTITCIPDGIRVNVSNAATTASKAQVVFFGGQDVRAKVGVIAHNTTAIGDTTVITAPGFAPQDVFVVSPNRGPANWDGTTTTNANLGMGVAVSGSGQGAICRAVSDNAATMVYSAGVHAAWAGVNCLVSDFPAASVSLGSFSSVGFTATTQEATTALQDGYLALSYGGKVRSWAGRVDPPASTGATAYTGPGWRPQFVMHFVTDVPTTSVITDGTDTFDDTDRGTVYGVFLADTSRQFSAGVVGDDAAADSVTASYVDTGLNILGTGNAAQFVGTWTGFTPTGWGITYTTTHSAAGWGWAIEAEKPLGGQALWFGN